MSATLKVAQYVKGNQFFIPGTYRVPWAMSVRPTLRRRAFRRGGLAWQNAWIGPDLYRFDPVVSRYSPSSPRDTVDRFRLWRCERFRPWRFELLSELVHARGPRWLFVRCKWHGMLCTQYRDRATVHPFSLLHPSPTMAQDFRANIHASMAVQVSIDLRVPNCETMRRGDRTRAGQQAPDMISSYAHMTPLSQAAAEYLFVSLPANVRDDPGNAQRAGYVAQLAHNAGRMAPAGCATLLPDHGIPDAGVTIYWSPGSAIFTGRTDASKFASFVSRNMDEGYFIAWKHLTGEEQWEWTEAWRRAGKTHVRVENETRGLAGTDLGLLTTVANVRAAMVVSPSLSRRRPAQHPVNAADWTNAANAAVPAQRRLF